MPSAGAWRTALAAALLGSGLGGGALAAYAWRTAKRVEHSHVVIPIPDLPPGLDGLRILHVADTHFPGNGESLERFLAAAGDREYDLVLATGDYADTQDGWPVVVEAFRRLRPGLGIYASLGGHERYPGLGPFRGWTGRHWARHGWRGELARLRRRILGRRGGLIDPAPLISALQEVGVTVLVNESRSIEVGGELVRLVAIDDAYLRRADLDRALPDPHAGGFRILLSHTPDGLRHPRASEVHVALSGHTHGGQIRFPLIGAPVRHAHSVDAQHPAGLHRVHGVPVFVSRGFGTALLPFRLGATPELAVVELRRAPSTGA